MLLSFRVACRVLTYDESKAVPMCRAESLTLRLGSAREKCSHVSSLDPSDTISLHNSHLTASSTDSRVWARAIRVTELCYKVERFVVVCGKVNKCRRSSIHGALIILYSRRRHPKTSTVLNIC